MPRAPVRHVLLCAALLGSGCTPFDFESAEAPLPAYCTARVQGGSQVDVEDRYLPRVVQCENGAASFEALKAQAVAARTFLYYRLRLVGYIRDGQQDQVYSCGRTPTAEQIRAVRETSGLVLSYAGETLVAHYVAGAAAHAPDCRGEGPSLANTERFVTYNEGCSGDAVTPTTLSDTDNPVNRGCMSQNGADCLSDAGHDYRDILHFYYGDDVSFVQAVGTCVVPSDAAGDQAGDPADGVPGDVLPDEGGQDPLPDDEPDASCPCDSDSDCTPDCRCDLDCASCFCDTSSECDLDERGDKCQCDPACPPPEGPFNADCTCDVDVQCNPDVPGGADCACDPDCSRCTCDVDLTCNTDERGCVCGCDRDCGGAFDFNGRCGCDVNFECNLDGWGCGCGCDPDCE